MEIIALLILAQYRSIKLPNENRIKSKFIINKYIIPIILLALKLFDIMCKAPLGKDAAYYFVHLGRQLTEELLC
jgi:hypothetical protein